ncbi:MAG: hypothetical protein Q9226_007383, partial [Calogaya cf. arnoldii]
VLIHLLFQRAESSLDIVKAIMDLLPFRFKNRNSQDSDRKSDGKSKSPQPKPKSSSTHTQSLPAAAASPTSSSIRTSTSSKRASSLYLSPRFALAPPPSPSPSAKSPSSHSPRTSKLPPNTDPLPSSYAALEGNLNHHASQLHALAMRVELLNEWIDLYGIVLGRLRKEVEKAVEEGEREREVKGNGEEKKEVKKKGEKGAIRENEEWKRGVHFELLPRANGSVMPVPLQQGEEGKRRKSAGDVPRVSLASASSGPIHGMPLSSPSKAGGKVDEKGRIRVLKEKAVEEHNGIQELRTRIDEMKRWRKEVEKAVVWQREEFWRVEKKMGKGRRESVLVGKVNGVDGETSVDGGRRVSVMDAGGNGEGQRRWSTTRDSKGGRLPNQREWEVMFSG